MRMRSEAGSKTPIPKRSEFDVNSSHLLTLIKSHYTAMSSAHQKVAIYVLASPGKVIYETSRHISEETGVCEATVVRFCRELGFNGFTDFKLRLAQDVVGMEGAVYEGRGIEKNDPDEEIFKKSMTSYVEGLRFVMTTFGMENFKMAVSMIAAADRIAFFSVGGSYTVACNAYWHLSYTGKQSCAPTDPGSQIMTAQSLKGSDLAFAISMSGQSKVPCLCLSIAKNRGIPTVSLTQNIKAEIHKFSDCPLIIHKGEPKGHELPDLSKLSQMAVIDALCLAVMAKSWDESVRCANENAKNIARQQF